MPRVVGTRSCVVGTPARVVDALALGERLLLGAICEIDGREVPPFVGADFDVDVGGLPTEAGRQVGWVCEGAHELDAVGAQLGPITDQQLDGLPRYLRSFGDPHFILHSCANGRGVFQAGG